MPTPPLLKDEIDARTRARHEADRESPGRHWGDALSRAEAEVFAINYDDFPRMLAVREAWLDFLGLTMGGPVFHSREAIQAERARRPELTAGDEPGFFTTFAVEVGGLTQRQADAIYHKDWFWMVRNAHVRYPDEKA